MLIRLVISKCSVLKIVGTTLVIGDSLLRHVELSNADLVFIPGIQLQGIATALCNRNLRPEGYAKVILLAGTNNVTVMQGDESAYARELGCIIGLLRFYNPGVRIGISAILPRPCDHLQSEEWVEAANLAFEKVAKRLKCIYFNSAAYYFTKGLVQTSLFQRSDWLHLSPPGRVKLEYLIAMIMRKL